MIITSLGSKVLYQMLKLNTVNQFSNKNDIYCMISFVIIKKIIK